MIHKAILLLLIAAMPVSAQTFSLEPLVEEHKQHIAPPSIQSAMRKIEEIDFKDCLKEINLNSVDQATYFSSLPLKLDSKEMQYYLVFPSAYCKAFFGAHAIAYWILNEDSVSHFTVLYRGRSDGFEVLKTQTKGLFDLKSVYGYSFVVLKYNGHQYVRTSSGDQIVPITAKRVKRAEPKEVEPVVYKGVKYLAPHFKYLGDKIERGYIEAWDIRSQKKLWELQVYKINYDKRLEQDAQDVFITSLTINDDKLLVTTEHNDVYEVNLQLQQVRKVK